MSDEPKLLPCPFCEGEVDLLTSGQIAWTRCPSCRAEGPVSKRGKDGAATAWNRRVPAPAVPDGVAAVVAYWRKELPRVEGFPAPLLAEKIKQTLALLEAQAAELARLTAENKQVLTEYRQYHKRMEAAEAENARLGRLLGEIATLGRCDFAKVRAALTQPTGDRND